LEVALHPQTIMFFYFLNKKIYIKKKKKKKLKVKQLKISSQEKYLFVCVLQCAPVLNVKNYGSNSNEILLPYHHYKNLNYYVKCFT